MPIDGSFVYQPPLNPLNILYEDNDLIIIDKPAGLLSVMGRLPEHQDSAYLRILERISTAKVTHRLDMATSGILMFAKHRDAEVAISRLFQTRNIEKKYIALVQGKLEGNGQVEVPLITDWENRPKQKVDFEQGKQAKTRYKSLAYNIDNDVSRVELIPITGRSHQLRVHMAYIGHPIMRDKIYHPNPYHTTLQRMALHACDLSFKHPITQQELHIHSVAEF